jgi:hypothetical protein
MKKKHRDARRKSLKHFCIAIPKDTPEVRRLILSLRKHGITTQVISKGKRSITPMDVIGFQYEFIMRQKDDDVVMYTDAYDVLFIQDKKKILDAFDKLDAPVVFAAEKWCWPDGDKRKLYPDIKSPWRYLNAGCFLGYAGALKSIVSMAHSYPRPSAGEQSSQGVYTNIYLKHKDAIQLDTQCRIFQTLFLSNNNIVFRKGAWRNKTTRTTPCVVHANSQRHKIEPIAKVLGYKTPAR